MNRLAGETSPYLLQHKDNPVDWYPWGDEAFERARAEDKPILLSVGYSACHWCHVMAHETFEHQGTAELMNELFVNIKVDREERPDVDAVYMEAVQAVTGQGGWPMTVFLTPDGRPFFGGTYFPRDRFAELLRQVTSAWTGQRKALEADADQLAEAIRAGTRVEGPKAGPETTLATSLLEAGYDALQKAYDPEWGGFGRAPKFPQPSMVEFVLRMGARVGDTDALAMVTTTLDAMAAGGIYDHLAGGFARYSVERTWLVPHFEKMLYDNALLLRLYLHGWQVTGEDRYRQVMEETAAYLLGPPMRNPEGGIHSAEDADSEGVEGRFYVWSLDDVEALGGPAAVDWYGVTRSGNWEGANILRRPLGAELLRPPEVEAARARLLKAREERVRPGLDDKVVTEWNAMAIAALADAGVALGHPEWVEAAEEIAGFLLRALRRDPDGRWLRSWQGGRPGRNLAVAIDYAWLIEAFTRLSEATGAAVWIAEAQAVADELLTLFWDDADGGLFTTGHDGERLIVRSKDTYDGATPSANSVAAVALLRLGALTAESRYTDAGTAICRLLEPLVATAPMAFTNLLVAVDLLVRGVTEVAITGERPDLVGAVQATYQPSAVLAWGEPYPSPLWEGRTGPAESGKAFVCRHYTCKAPIVDPGLLLDELARSAATG